MWLSWLEHCPIACSIPGQCIKKKKKGGNQYIRLTIKIPIHSPNVNYWLIISQTVLGTQI